MNNVHKKCNVCGRELKEFSLGNYFDIDLGEVGYGSIYDGLRFSCTLCYDCFDKIVNRIDFAVNPFTEEE